MHTHKHTDHALAASTLTEQNKARTKHQIVFKRWLSKLPQIVEEVNGKLVSRVSKFLKITPSHAYKPTTKAMSRRDRIRAGLQKRNQRNVDVLDDLPF